jgi:hypothetical protein
LAFEWMMGTRNGDAFREVLKMGSVSWCPLTPFHTANFYSAWLAESSTGMYCV